MALRWKQGYLNHRSQWARNPQTRGLYFVISTRRGWMLKIEGDIIGTYGREEEAKEVAEKIMLQANRLRELGSPPPSEERGSDESSPQKMNGDTYG